MASLVLRCSDQIKGETVRRLSVPSQLSSTYIKGVDSVLDREALGGKVADLAHAVHDCGHSTIRLSLIHI